MRVKTAFALIILWLADTVSAQCANNLPTLLNVMVWLQQIGWPLAFFMLVYMGIKWMISEGPQERENARRGVIYVIIGLLLLVGGVELVYNLLCF